MKTTPYPASRKMKLRVIPITDAEAKLLKFKRGFFPQLTSEKQKNKKRLNDYLIHILTWFIFGIILGILFMKLT